MQAIDAATGQVLWDTSQTALQNTGEPEVYGPQLPAEQQSAGERYPDIGGAFGVEGIAKNFANFWSDMLGMGTPYEERAQTGSYLRVVGEGLLNNYAKSYSNRPPVFIMERLEKLFPKASELSAPGQWRGADSALQDFQALQRAISQEMSGLAAQLGSRTLSPQARLDLENKISANQTALAQIEQILGAFRASLPSFDGGVSPEDEQLMNDLLRQ